MWSFNSTRSRIAASSSNDLPTSVPFPAIVSSSTVVVCSGFKISFSISEIRQIPSSAPFVYLTLLSYFFLRIYVIYSPAGFQESLSSLFSISFRSTVYATFTSLSFLMINSESPYSEPLSAQSYVYPSLVHGYFPSK